MTVASQPSYLTGSKHRPMPRRSKDSQSKRSSKLQLENLYRKCCYCNINRPTVQFNRHRKACKIQWEILHERRKTKAATHLPVEPNAKSLSTGHHPEFVQGSSAMSADFLDVDSDMADDTPHPNPAPSPCAIDNDFVATKQTGEYRP